MSKSMLIDNLRSQEKYYAESIQRSNKFISMFRMDRDHSVKLSAVRKLIKDISFEDVMYTRQEMDSLKSGKLWQLLQKHQHELPAGFSQLRLIIR